MDTEGLEIEELKKEQQYLQSCLDFFYEEIDTIDNKIKQIKKLIKEKR